MNIEQITIAATDRFKLAVTVHREADADCAGVIVICAATGVKRQFYQPYARYLAEQGFVVLTFDYRGIGDSRPVTLNKFKARMSDWGEKDIAGVLDWVRQAYPENKIMVIGHSVAGQVLGLAHNNDLVSAVVTVASQSGYWRFWPWNLRYVIFVFWYMVIPLLTTLFARFPSKFVGMGEDLPAGVAFQWASWGRDPDYILGKNSLTSKDNFSQFTGSWLSYSLENDFFAPAEAVDRLVTFYPNARPTRKHLTAGDLGVKRFGHFDFFKQRFKDSLWQETVEWLSRQTASESGDEPDQSAINAM